MKTLWILTAAFIGLLAFSTGRLSAQGVVRPPGVLPPVYSPYLNLLRNNNPAYLNYYGLVRPEIAFGNSIYGLQQGVATNAAGIAGLDASAAGLPLTGHPTAFMNTSHYFLNRGGQGTPAGGAAAASSRGGQAPTASRGGQAPAVSAPH